MLPTAQVFPRMSPAVTSRFSMSITRSHDRILQALGRFHYLTVKQITRLLFTPGMTRDVQRWLSEFTLMRYVACEEGFSQGAGRPPLIYWLDRAGRDYVSTLGIWVPDRYRRSERGQHKRLFYEHTLALNDALISLDLLGTLHAGLWVEEIIHEQRLKREKIRVVLPDGQQRSAEPDAWVDLRVARAAQTPLRFPLVIELDRGSEEQRQFREKIRTLLALIDGPYQAHFRTEYVTFAIIVAAPDRPERRREQLRAWAEAELRDLGRMDDGGLFFFTATPAATAAPDAMWLGPSWHVPFEPSPQPLLLLPEGEI
jgi:hypothetical protein